MHNPTPTRCLIFDLDTTLPFPTYFHKYVTETFRSDLALRPEHHRWVDMFEINFTSNIFHKMEKKTIYHWKRIESFHEYNKGIFIIQMYFSFFLLYIWKCDWWLRWKMNRFFRVIPAEQYLAEFSSDRRHMRRPDGTWIKPPPPYPPIQSSGKSQKNSE